MKLKQEVNALFESHLRDWELARHNYNGLQKVRVNSLLFEDFKIILQFNPKRIISSAAKTDPQSIMSRPCFLCEKNRPPEQQGIWYHENLILLVNPYPVFRGHLTIPTFVHEPQHILPKFSIMLELAKDLPHYVIIYNGPQCGASAPDHFHFQAVQKGNMPIETDFFNKNNCSLHAKNNSIGIHTWNNYRRRLITLSGSSIPELVSVFNTVYKLLALNIPSEDEPMMNILADYEEGKFVVHLFPRRLHRPDRYFATGASQLLISPASIDLGGVVIIPREGDFNKVSREDVLDVFQQVCVDDRLIKYLIDNLTGGQ